MGNSRINPDFGIENFYLKHEISLTRVHKTILLVTKVQLTLAISNSLISNNRLSRSENLFPA